MFNTSSCSSNALSNASTYTVCAEKPKCGAELSTPSYSLPKTASSCGGSKPVLTIPATVPAAGYGGSVTIPAPVVIAVAGYGGGLTVPTPAPKSPCGDSKQGLNVRVEADDRKPSQPLGGRESENERENDKSPLKKLAAKCGSFLTGLVTPPSPAPTGGAGYGGTVTTPVVVAPSPKNFMVSNAGSGFGSQCTHFNQGIGNGAEGGDPGKSSPRGGSNDETGRTPGQSCKK
jgi:hypothetical protein